MPQPKHRNPAARTPRQPPVRKAAATTPAPSGPQRPLSAAQKRYLRGFTHALKPVIQVGQKGITPALLEELAGALAHHELIKVKLADDDRAARAAAIESIRNEAGAELVQAIGKTAAFYRCNPDRAAYTLPR
ncbi:YhbY family RNA-binding protein [Dokdonella sp.]|uniref:YhbY family RNA-binding protein n=1 Tax=Dokdonella sp. TaxID=2291710 RepID=UPI003AF52402